MPPAAMVAAVRATGGQPSIQRRARAEYSDHATLASSTRATPNARTQGLSAASALALPALSARAVPGTATAMPSSRVRSGTSRLSSQPSATAITGAALPTMDACTGPA